MGNANLDNKPAENAGEPKVKKIDFEHKAMKQAKENGRNDYLPNNAEIRSPYDTDETGNFPGVNL